MKKNSQFIYTQKLYNLKNLTRLDYYLSSHYRSNLNGILWNTQESNKSKAAI